MKPIHKALATTHAGRHAGREDATVTGRVAPSAVNARHLLSAELGGLVEGLSAEETLALLGASHEVCRRANATRGNIDVRLSSH
jgi:organic hydroperoxide reductase OsmC/OhrA